MIFLISSVVVKKVYNEIVLHGTFLEILNKGVLLIGPPGSGKSDCALQLLSRQHRLIADDAPLFYKDKKGIIKGTCPAHLQNLLEIKALGIIDVSTLFYDCIVREKKLDLIISLSISSKEKLPLITPVCKQKILLETHIPEVSLDLALSQNAAILIECTVKWMFSLEHSTGQS